MEHSLGSCVVSKACKSKLSNSHFLLLPFVVIPDLCFQSSWMIDEEPKVWIRREISLIYYSEIIIPSF